MPSLLSGSPPSSSRACSPNEMRNDSVGRRSPHLLERKAVGTVGKKGVAPLGGPRRVEILSETCCLPQKTHQTRVHY